MDTFYLLIGLGLFVITFLVIELCDRLNGGKS